ncbi:MAG: hypothetical protein ACOYO1_15705 [Bacteroidales bacterium]
MSKKALEDTKYELIKAHVLDAENSPLNEEQQFLYKRVISVSKILDDHPIQKQAVALHLAKFESEGLSRSQAYEDVRIALRLFPSLHNFEFDFWKTWILNDCVKNIERCRKIGTHQSLKVIEFAHSNMLKAIGEKPECLDDPKRTEKNNFFLLFQNMNTQVSIDIDNLHKLPNSTIKELNRALFAGKEITVTDAEQEMNT